MAIWIKFIPMNKLKFIVMAFAIAMLSSCGSCSSKKSDTSYLETLPYEVQTYEEPEEKSPESMFDDKTINIPYTEQFGNTITIYVKINGMGLEMIYDTGASNTTITLAEAKYLYEKGTLTENDFVGIEQFQSADGSIHDGLSIIIRELKIGDEISLYDIEATIVKNQQAPLLLGQSVLKHFRQITVDRENEVVKFLK
jgi:aspartyl protease family protein